MAREKGTGNLQQEKSGRWTVRIGINGHRISRSARTTDKTKAEAFLNRFLAPLGLGAQKLPLAEAWHHYEMSPNRRDIAKSTLDSKRTVWMAFARWMEKYHIEIGHLAEVTEEAVAEYLMQFKCNHSATTYNNHVCVLREVFRTLAEKAGVVNDPWANVCLRADDSVSRRELSLDEVERLYSAASKEGKEWKLLLATGIYTGLRLGDCCRLKWECVNLERQLIQVVPEKTKRHAHGKPVTIPIHPSLMEELVKAKEAAFSRRDAEAQREVLDRINRIDRIDGSGDSNALQSNLDTPTHENPVNPVNDVSKPPTPQNQPLCLCASARDNFPSGFVNPAIADLYLNRKWQLDAGLRRIFKAANITMSFKMDGRCRKTVIASFHSLRHTFVSLSANAGVPLPVVQSIVGHCSTTMTRHYYHENEDVLRQAVEAIPAIGAGAARTPRVGLPAPGAAIHSPAATPRTEGVPARLKRLDRLFARNLVMEEEFKAARARILAEL